jgi:hypothetical protein
MNPLVDWQPRDVGLLDAASRILPPQSNRPRLSLEHPLDAPASSENKLRSIAVIQKLAVNPARI